MPKIYKRETNISNYKENVPRVATSYYEERNGPFEIFDSGSVYVYKFNGLHFVCLGNDYFHHCKDEIYGLELLEEPNVTEVDTYPDNLIP
jgi:hypothetical protein